MEQNSLSRLAACVAVLGMACSAESGSRRPGLVPPAGAGGLQPPTAAVPAGMPTGGGLPPNPGAGAGAGGFFNPPGGAPVDVPECLEPVIMFVIDGSGSMCADFGAGTRWTELRNALVGGNGLITQLDSRGSFGMLLYDGSIDTALATAEDSATANAPACAAFGVLARSAGECTQFIEVAPDRGIGAQLSQAFPQQQLGGSTPTDKALQRALDQLVMLRTQNPNDTSPRYIILATDGAPNDICVGGQGGDGSAQRQGVLNVVQQAATMGIITFVISLASDDPELQVHLDEVARAGDPGNPNARTYNPSTPEDLISNMRDLLGTAFGCDLE